MRSSRLAERHSIDIGRKRPHLLEVSRYSVAVAGPAGRAGLKIAHLTDLHLGFGGMEPVVHAAVERVKAEAPDLVLLTGDYVDDNAPGPAHALESLLCGLDAPLGVFATLGNHEHRRGAAAATARLLKSGVRVLTNESVQASDGLWLAGIDDLEEGRPDPEEALRKVPEDAACVVLSHNPRIMDRIAHRQALLLAGHTHGAQIRVPFPSPYLVCLVHLRCRYVAGWYRKGKAQVYVSRGLGVTGRPVRYRCPSELVFFTLTEPGA